MAHEGHPSFCFHMSCSMKTHRKGGACGVEGVGLRSEGELGRPGTEAVGTYHLVVVPSLFT